MDVNSPVPRSEPRTRLGSGSCGTFYRRSQGLQAHPVLSARTARFVLTPWLCCALVHARCLHARVENGIEQVVVFGAGMSKGSARCRETLLADKDLPLEQPRLVAIDLDEVALTQELLEIIDQAQRVRGKEALTGTRIRSEYPCLETDRKSIVPFQAVPGERNSFGEVCDQSLLLRSLRSISHAPSWRLRPIRRIKRRSMGAAITASITLPRPDGALFIQ